LLCVRHFQINAINLSIATACMYSLEAVSFEPCERSACLPGLTCCTYLEICRTRASQLPLMTCHQNYFTSRAACVKLTLYRCFLSAHQPGAVRTDRLTPRCSCGSRWRQNGLYLFTAELLNLKPGFQGFVVFLYAPSEQSKCP
jgi:hypothetical protein